MRWHLAPDALLRLRPDGGGAIVTVKAGDVLVEVSSGSDCRLTAGTAGIAVGYAETAEAPVLTAVVDAELPVRISTTWRLAGHRATLP